ncbi:Rho GTPase-activating protein 44, partial [Frankliniella fusca]
PRHRWNRDGFPRHRWTSRGCSARGAGARGCSAWPESRWCAVRGCGPVVACSGPCVGRPCVGPPWGRLCVGPPRDPRRRPCCRAAARGTVVPRGGAPERARQPASRPGGPLGAGGDRAELAAAGGPPAADGGPPGVRPGPTSPGSQPPADGLHGGARRASSGELYVPCSPP